MSDWIELSDDDFKDTLKDVPVAVVDFYAPWCGSCRMAAPFIKRLCEEFSLPFYKVDAEKNPKARSLVEIENLPTIAVWKKGTVAASLCTTKEDSLRAFLQEQSSQQS